MNVVGSSANCDGDGIEFAENPAEIRVNVGANWIGKERCAIGSGKGDVEDEVRVGVGHSFAPLGLTDRWEPLYPRLAPWG